MAQGLFRNVRNVGSDDFRAQFGFTDFDHEIDDMNRGQGVIFDQFAADDDSVFEDVTGPWHEGYNQILAECQFAVAGCRAVGLTGSAEKAALAQARYGYQAMINYRDSTDLPAVIREACPEGNDIFFDNTGGAIADAAIRTMRLHGRIIQCGTAANASWTPVPTGPRAEREILTRRLRWSGFIIFDHIAEFEAAATRLTEFALDGKIVHDEEILPGLEHAPGAIAQLYRGDNHGKLIIAVD